MSIPLDWSHVQQQFIQALHQRGLGVRGAIQADGEIHRCDVTSKPGHHGAGDGAYLLHVRANFAAGGFQNWTDGEGWEKWNYTRPGWTPSVEEQREIDAAIEQARSKYEKEKAELRAKAWQKAKRMWNEADPALASFSYCRDKQVEPHGLRQWQFPDGAQVLLVPMYDSDNKLRNLQFIHTDGRKHGLTGGQQGDCHFWIAKPARGQPICICEGWSTGQSIHEATGFGVVVAFNTGNLLAVAKWVREQYPEDQIILCADDDHRTTGNPGITKAGEAARAISALVAVPTFADDRQDTDTDFNDMLVACGAAAVKAAIAAAAPPADDADSEHASERDATDDDLEQRLEELAALSRVEYDQRRKQVADDLGIRVKILDAEVAARRQDRGDTDNLPDYWGVEPWPEAVKTAALLLDIEHAITSYVATLHDRALVVAAWTMFTWVHDQATHSPLLMVTSAEANSGKSTLLGVVNFLARRSLQSVGISSAALFRTLEKWQPTLIVDEADTILTNNEDLRAVVNSGWTRGQGVIRTVGDNHEPTLFSTFAPKAIGMKGSKLPDTTLSRAIQIELKRKLPDETVADFAHQDDERLAGLRRRLLRWAEDHPDILRDAKPETIPGFHNRVRANWAPLLAIAEAAGRKQRLWKAARAIERANDDKASLGVQLLADLRAIFDANEQHQDTPEQHEGLLSSYLIDELIRDPEKPWTEYRRGKPLTQKQLASLLGQFGISSEEIHPKGAGAKHGKGYKRTRFADAFARYLVQTPPDPPIDPRIRANPHVRRTSSAFRSARGGFENDPENDDLSYSRNDLRGCADRNPSNGPSAHTIRAKRTGVPPNGGSSARPPPADPPTPPPRSNGAHAPRDYDN